MLKTKKELNEWIEADSRNYKSQIANVLGRYKNNIFSTPISDQKYIWKYIKALRYSEYHINNSGIYHKIAKIFYLKKLRRLSYITGFQIPPNTLGKGITIWHWGSIIINPSTKIGENVTLYPGTLCGWKEINGPAPIIGNNVFIGSGSKIIGACTIHDNVIIGQNCVITHDIPEGSIIVQDKNRILECVK